MINYYITAWGMGWNYYYVLPSTVRVERENTDQYVLVL